MENKPSACAFIPKEEVEKALKNTPVVGKHHLEPFKAFSVANKLPINILEDSAVSNDAELHCHESDLWYCLEGEVEFIYGGEMAAPWPNKNADGSANELEWKAKEIKDGRSVVLKSGDWLWIPAGQPHQHKCVGTARLAIIKIPKV